MTQHKELQPRTVVVRTTCNGCAADCPKGYATPVREQGGAESTILSDLITYSFDLCEACLVRIMDGLMLSPTVTDRDCAVGEEYTYAVDRERWRAQMAREAASKAEHERALASGLCPWLVGDGTEHGLTTCGEPPVGTVDGTQTCRACMADEYASPGEIVREGLASRLPERAWIGTRYLESVRAGHTPRWPGEHERTIYVATAIAMLLKETALAASELHRLTGMTPLPQSFWCGPRVPVSFKPSEMALARTANDWLILGQALGYRNAAAAAMLGLGAEGLWKYYHGGVPPEEPKP